MADWVGETVLVTLRDPPNTKVRGFVTDIVEQQLCLKDVVWLPSQNRMEMFVVDGPGNLLDLEILAPGSHEHEAPTTTASIEPDVDPAILSYVKPPSKNLKAKARSPQSSKPLNPGPGTGLALSQSSTPQQTIAQSTAANGPRDKPHTQNHSGTSATLTGPFEDLSINGFNRPSKTTTSRDDGGTNMENGTNRRPQQNDTPTKGKHRRRGKGRGKDSIAEVAEQMPLQEKPVYADYGQIPAINGKQSRKPRGNGWRQTPLLEENTHPKVQQRHMQDIPGSRKILRREEQRHRMTEKSGWATEEATDIQEMGDFDFTANLSKFDKRGVFDQLKQEDTTADEERLVSFNRLPPRAGTAGGKNLHFTENVLDSPLAESRRAWSSHHSEADSEARISSGRSSRRNLSRISHKQPPSRKGSAIAADQYGTGSGSVPDSSKARTRWTSRGPSSKLQANRDISSSRDPTMTHLPAPAQSKPSFRIASSNQYCPCLTPLQMLELEHVASGEFAMTDELLTENASRSIAVTATKLLQSSKELNDRIKGGFRPVVVLLAGNTKSGARAVAGVRQLRNHGIRVMVTVLGLERDDDLLDTMQRQLALYEKCGGHLVKPARLSSTLRNLHATPDLIIDALLGMHLSFDDLRTDDQETYFGLADWAKNSPQVMAIDVPSGIDASIGTATTSDGTDIVIRADAVLSLGAPKTGLLSAMGKALPLDQVKLLVGDICIPNRAWRKFGTRSTKYGIGFGGEWAASLKFQAGID